MEVWILQLGRWCNPYLRTFHLVPDPESRCQCRRNGGPIITLTAFLYLKTSGTMQRKQVAGSRFQAIKSSNISLQ